MDHTAPDKLTLQHELIVQKQRLVPEPGVKMLMAQFKGCHSQALPSRALPKHRKYSGPHSGYSEAFIHEMPNWKLMVTYTVNTA